MKLSPWLVAIAAAAAFSAPAVAQTLRPNPHAKAQGSNVGVFSSRVTGNGAVVREQARAGNRSEIVQGIHEAEGRGRDVPVRRRLNR